MKNAKFTQEEYDIQKELEAKFDELFGPIEDDDNDNENTVSSESISDSIIRQLSREYTELEGLANEAYHEGNYIENLELWKQAREVAQQLQDIEKELNSCYGICQAYYHMKQYKNALYYSFRVTNNYASADPNKLYMTISRQFQIGGFIVLPIKSQLLLLEQLKIVIERYRLNKQAAYLLDETYLYMDTGNYKKALAKTQRSYQMKISGGSGYTISSHLKGFLWCYYLDNNLPQIENTIQKINALNTEHTYEHNCSIVLCEVLNNYLQHNYSFAYSNALQYLTLRRKSGYNLVLSRPLYFIITIASSSGNPELAKGFLFEFIQLYREYRKSYKCYRLRYDLYRSMGHYHASKCLTSSNSQEKKREEHLANNSYNKALQIAYEIDDLLCCEVWKQEIQKDLCLFSEKKLPYGNLYY